MPIVKIEIAFNTIHSIFDMRITKKIKLKEQRKNPLFKKNYNLYKLYYISKNRNL